MGRIMRRWILSSALVETLLFSGCLLGWNSLSPILIDVGVLSQDCHSDLERSEERSNDTGRAEAVSSMAELILGSRSNKPQDPCTSQEQSLTLGFTVGTFFIWGAFLPLQLLLGYVHIRSLRQIGGALVSVSCLMLVYCLVKPQTLSLFLPFALIAQGLGGSCVLFSSLMLPHILEDVGPLFPSLVIASFSASATIFTIIKVIYFSGIPIVPIILGYGTMSCAMVLNSTLCWCLSPPREKEDTMYSVSLRLNCYEAMNKKKPQEDEWCQKSLKHKFQNSLKDRERILSFRRTLSFKRPDAPAQSPLLESLVSPTFLLHLLSDSTLLTWIYFYVSSVNSHLQSQEEGRWSQSDVYSSVFGALQMLGLFAAPVISILLHNHRLRKRPRKTGQTAARNSYKQACSMKRLSAIYALRSLLVIGFGISCLIPSLQLQVVSFILHVAIRASMFLVSSTLYLSVFPGQHFGALLGINTFISSILSLVQYPIFLLLMGPLRGDPFWIHGTFLALSLAAVALPIHRMVTYNQRHRRPLSRPIHLHKVTPPTTTEA
ncbi:large neutral amino acids transporter small subunit 4-like [Bufo bufo]|uniref:large neutral amino acids transporter small subunit 4-like n=1 Tax=Bufo bufo TaxID=8384 RepID=UPI001ABEAA72|nr:large neutral amino acids transporter small subunit 4-like [Bufo bufo]